MGMLDDPYAGYFNVMRDDARPPSPPPDSAVSMQLGFADPQDFKRLNDYAGPTPVSGSLLPLSRNAFGHVSFDPSAGIVGSLSRSATLPGDVYTGKVDPASPEGIDRAAEMAMNLGMLAAPMPRPVGSLATGSMRAVADPRYPNYSMSVKPEEFLRPGAPSPTWDESMLAMRNQHAAGLSDTDLINSWRSAAYSGSDDLGNFYRRHLEDRDYVFINGEPYDPKSDIAHILRRQLSVYDYPPEQISPLDPRNIQHPAVPDMSPGHKAIFEKSKQLFRGNDSSHYIMSGDLHNIGITDLDQFKRNMVGDAEHSSVNSYGPGSFTISAALRNGGGMDRTINTELGEVHHDFLRLPDTEQGKGMARDLLRSQVEQYNKMNMNSVHLYANLDVGGYAWAKYGFVPEQQSWDGLRYRINHSLPHIKQYLDPQVYDHIKTLAASRDPKSIWDIADIDPSHLVTNNEGQFVPVSKHLLLGDSWDGKLDLKDPETMARFNNYVGPRTK